VDLHRNLTKDGRIGNIRPGGKDQVHDYQGNKELGMSTEAQPEVFVIFDYANTVRFNKNNTAIVDYLRVYFHGVNNRYSTVSEPRITFRISGVMAVSVR